MSRGTAVARLCAAPNGPSGNALGCMCVNVCACVYVCVFKSISSITFKTTFESFLFESLY